MEYTPIKPAEYFIRSIPAPSLYTDITSMPPLYSPFSLSFMHTCTYMYFFCTCSHKHEHAPPESFFESLPDWSALSPGLLQLRCFLFCQNASLQVYSDLKTSSPWGCLQHSLLSSFKHNLSRSLLSAPLLPPCSPPRPAPSSVQFCSLPASSCCCLSPAR